jgi:hypothetical protein
MFRVFNMGIGFCVVVAPDLVATVIDVVKRHGKRAMRIGHAVRDPKRRVEVPQYNLRGEGKAFHERGRDGDLSRRPALDGARGSRA